MNRTHHVLLFPLRLEVYRDEIGLALGLSVYPSKTMLLVGLRLDMPLPMLAARAQDGGTSWIPARYASRHDAVDKLAAVIGLYDNKRRGK